MPISTPPPADEETFDFEVTVSGITKRDTAQRLIKALASIPVVPLIIAPIGNRKDRLFGVVDQAHGDSVCYVQVAFWGGRKRGLPHLHWSRDPAYFGGRIKSQGEKALTDCTSGVREDHMVLKCRLRTGPATVQE